ncbi:MAG: P63C domain-containing protein [Chthoniobacteraceae bacterium]
MEEKPSKQHQAGGIARAKSLSAEQRKEIAQRAATARWNADLPKVICGTAERPLRIGEIEIPCYVLEGEKRVLVQRAIVSAIGMARGSSSKGGGDRLAHFVNQNRLQSFISDDLRAVTAEPIKFIAPNGSIAHGYEAEFLAKLCFAVLDAERAGILQEQQLHIAAQCRILIEGFSIVGINALVDEATGYQDIRARNALAKILEQYVAKELRPYAPTFPMEFYRQIFRLKGWPFDPESVKRPQVIGHYTNDLIYARLAPGILKEIQKKNPRLESGRLKNKNFQWLTGEIGEPRLLAHFEGVMSLMKISDNWDEMKKLVTKVYPIVQTTELGFDVEVTK